MTTQKNAFDRALDLSAEVEEMSYNLAVAKAADLCVDKIHRLKDMAAFFGMDISGIEQIGNEAARNRLNEQNAHRANVIRSRKRAAARADIERAMLFGIPSLSDALAVL